MINKTYKAFKNQLRIKRMHKSYRNNIPPILNAQKIRCNKIMFLHEKSRYVLQWTSGHFSSSKIAALSTSTHSIQTTCMCVQNCIMSTLGNIMGCPAQQLKNPWLFLQQCRGWLPFRVWRINKPASAYLKVQVRRQIHSSQSETLWNKLKQEWLELGLKKVK